MTDLEFEKWHDWVKRRACEHKDIILRTAAIAGFFEAFSKEIFSGDQVRKILALRYPEEKE